MMEKRRVLGLDLTMVPNSAGGWSYEWQDNHGAVRCSGWTLALTPEDAAYDAERHLRGGRPAIGKVKR